MIDFDFNTVIIFNSFHSLHCLHNRSDDLFSLVLNGLNDGGITGQTAVLKSIPSSEHST